MGLRCMRRDPATGSYSYNDSYALNSGNARLRRGTNTSQGSHQYYRAGLVMGRFSSPTAFTPTNPDYYTEAIWASDAAKNAPGWNQIVGWDQLYQDEYNNGNHDPGFQNNTRVLYFDKQIWVKSFATGLWRRLGGIYGANLGFTGTLPTFAAENQPTDYQQGVMGGIGDSTRTVPPSGSNSSGTYYVPHSYWGYRSDYTPSDLAAVCIVGKVSLILHDNSGPDDRHLSRYLYAIGGDYYPTTNVHPYPGIGTSAHLRVTAKWPEWEYRVMHTETWADFLASHPTVT